MFSIKSENCIPICQYFAAELEEPKTGKWGKGLKIQFPFTCMSVCSSFASVSVNPAIQTRWDPSSLACNLVKREIWSTSNFVFLFSSIPDDPMGIGTVFYTLSCSKMQTCPKWKKKSWKQWEKEKLLVICNFSISHMFSPTWRTFQPFSSNLKLSFANTLSLEGLKFVIWYHLEKS